MGFWTYVESLQVRKGEQQLQEGEENAKKIVQFHIATYTTDLHKASYNKEAHVTKDLRAAVWWRN